MSDVLHDLNQTTLQLITLGVEMMQQQMQQQNQLIATLLERLCPSNTQTSHYTPAESQPSAPADTENQACPEHQAEQPQTMLETAQNTKLSFPKVIADSIPNADHAKCQTYLAPLSPIQQNNVFAVFSDMLTRDKVRFPTQLFKSLAKRALHNQLNVPQTVAPSTPAYPYTQQTQTAVPYPVPPPKEPETAAQTAQREAQETREEEQSLRQMLHINSGIQGITPQALAEKLQLSHLLPV